MSTREDDFKYPYVGQAEISGILITVILFIVRQQIYILPANFGDFCS